MLSSGCSPYIYGLQITQQFIISDESYRQFKHTDTRGNETIGIGFNLKEGLTLEESIVILQLRIKNIERQLLQKLKWYINLNIPRQLALINMSYQLGVGGLLGFKDMLTALSNKDYEQTAKCALDSDWGREFPARANRIAKILETGILIEKDFEHVNISNLIVISYK